MVIRYVFITCVPPIGFLQLYREFVRKMGNKNMN